MSLISKLLGTFERLNIFGYGTKTPVIEAAADIDSANAAPINITNAGQQIAPDSVCDFVASVVVFNTGATGGVHGDLYRADFFGQAKRIGAAAPVFQTGASPAPTNTGNSDADLATCAPIMVIIGNGVFVQWTGIVNRTLKGCATFVGTNRK